MTHLTDLQSALTGGLGSDPGFDAKGHPILRRECDVGVIDKAIKVIIQTCGCKDDKEGKSACGWRCEGCKRGNFWIEVNCNAYIYLNSGSGTPSPMARTDPSIEDSAAAGALVGGTITATADNDGHVQLTLPPCLDVTVVASGDNVAPTKFIENVDYNREEDAESVLSCEVNDDLTEVVGEGDCDEASVVDLDICGMADIDECF